MDSPEALKTEEGVVDTVLQVSGEVGSAVCTYATEGVDNQVHDIVKRGSESAEIRRLCQSMFLRERNSKLTQIEGQVRRWPGRSSTRVPRVAAAWKCTPEIASSAL